MNNITLNILPSNYKPLPICLYSVSANYKQDPLNRYAGCDFYQILLVVDGEGTLIYNKKTYPLKKGSAFFTSPHIPVEYRGNEKFTTAFLTLKGYGITQLANYFNCKDFLFFRSINLDKYLYQINKIIKEYYTYKRESILSALSYSFYVDFFEDEDVELQLINRIILYIEKSFTKKLALDEIASAHGISVSKLCHDFKKELGCTVFEYILNLRLTYAQNVIISNSNVTIKDVAFSCGFDDVSYFCKAYKSKFSVTPSVDKTKMKTL